MVASAKSKWLNGQRGGTVSARLQPVRLGVAWRGVGDNVCIRHLTSQYQFTYNFHKSRLFLTLSFRSLDHPFTSSRFSYLNYCLLRIVWVVFPQPIEMRCRTRHVSMLSHIWITLSIYTIYFLFC